jgi:ABC-type polysaccharide/polyol phosphate export permease
MISLPIAYFCVFFRDVDNIVNHLMRLWFFGSPVVWYEEMIPAQGRWLLEMNPMTHFLASYRNVFIYNTSPDYGLLLLIGMISLFFILMMIFFYSQNEHKIIKAL